MNAKITETYNKTYKLLLLVPAIILVFCLIYMGYFYSVNGDFIRKDVSLTGGTSITVFDSNINIIDLKDKLESKFPGVALREISDIGDGGIRGATIETQSSVEEIKPEIESILGYKLNNENSSIEFSGETLSRGFYLQLLASIISAFVLMAWVVFLIFGESWKMKGISTMITFFAVFLALQEVQWLKALSILAVIIGAGICIFGKNSSNREKMVFLTVAIVLIGIISFYPSKLLLPISLIFLILIYIYTSIPSFAIIFSAFADILMTLVVVNLIGMELSGAGIIAFLMLIGYSVDTDILLTSRLLKNKDGTLNQRLWGAFKTGMTMTLTSIAAVGISLIVIYNLSETLRQIFTILLIGLAFDIFNTWVTNASLLKWYMEVKK